MPKAFEGESTEAEGEDDHADGHGAAEAGAGDSDFAVVSLQVAPADESSVWDLHHYAADPASGWWIHRDQPQWTAVPGLVFCHTPSGRFYDVNRQPVNYDFASGTISPLNMEAEAAHYHYSDHGYMSQVG